VLRLFRRRSRLPADRRPALDREERVLAWAGAGEDDQVIVVTNRGLWLPGREHRLGWHEIHKAVWSGRELSVTPAEVVEERDGYVVVADRPVESCLLLDPGNVPDQIRARVTRSVAYTSHQPVGDGGVRVVGRRVAGVNGLTWTVRYDPGTTANDAEVVEQTGAVVAAARAAAQPGA
jgi:hypothetical protein